MTESIKFCPNCGTKNSENGSFCGMCGSPLKLSAPTNQINNDVQQAPQIKRTSGFAITSLVLGIIGFIPIFSRGLIFALAAIIFGAVAISQTRSKSNHKGRGIAIVGFCLGIAGLVFAFIWFV